jgi:hypothetical protein
MLAEGMADGSVRRADLEVLAASLVVVVTSYVVSARVLADARTGALDELGRLVDGWLRP